MGLLLYYDFKFEKSGIFLSFMGVFRVGYVMVVLGGRLYVVGGLGEIGDLLSFEVYELRIDSWIYLVFLFFFYVGVVGVVL